MKMFLVVLCAVLIGAGSLRAGDKPAYKYDFTKIGGFEKTTIPVSWAKRLYFGNNSMKVWISNEMMMGEVASTDPLRLIGLDYPLGANIEHLYGGGPIIGGIVNGQRRVSAAYWEGTQEFDPEIKDSSRDRLWMSTATTDTSLDPNAFGYYKRQMGQKGIDDDHDGKVDEDDLDGLDNDGDWNPLTDDIGADGVPDSLETGCLGGYDPVKNPDPAFDNYSRTRLDLCRVDQNGANLHMDDKNKYTEKNGLPDHGEPNVDEDFGAISDHDVYFAATDTFKTPAVSGLKPLGIKIWAKAYAFDDTAYAAFLPFSYYFINVGRNVIKNVYLGWDADMDLGPRSNSNFVTNDYSGYIPELHTAYIHNSIDRGSTPLGVTILGTSRRLDSLNFMYQWWEGGNTVQLDSDQYSWLDCEAFGAGCIKPNQPSATTGDMRLILGFGPFGDMNPGDTLRMNIALVSGSGIDNGPTPMVDNIKKAIGLFGSGFHRPVVPISPCVTIDQGFKKVTVKWGRNVICGNGRPSVDPMSVWDDSNKIADSYPDTSWRRINPPEGHTRGGRIFEGYRLYRSEDPADPPSPSTFTLLKQYDLKDEFPFNFGLDTMYVDSNLVRGRRYHYAVTSFGIPDRTIFSTQVSSGVFRSDTVYTTNPESPIGALGTNMSTVDLAFSPSERADQVLVVPNPYRVDQDYTFESGGWEGRAREWTENNRLLKFIHLPKKCTVRVFTVAGDLVATLEHDDPVRGELTWNLLSDSNRALASGVYIFSVESQFGRQIGKFALIR